MQEARIGVDHIDVARAIQLAAQGIAVDLLAQEGVAGEAAGDFGVCAAVSTGDEIRDSDIVIVYGQGKPGNLMRSQHNTIGVGVGRFRTQLRISPLQGGALIGRARVDIAIL